MHKTSIQIARELSPAIQSNQWIAWIGAGVSTLCGYPQWEDAIKKLCMACGVATPSEINGNSDILLTKAEECKTKNETAYKKKLFDMFNRESSLTRDVLHYLVELPFAGYITTNFDPLLWKAANSKIDKRFDLYYYPALPLLFNNPGKTRPVYHVHGFAHPDKKPTNIDYVLSNSEYREAYKHIVSSFLLNIFIYYNVVFIGTSLTDKNLINLLKKARDIRNRIRCDVNSDCLRNENIRSAWTQNSKAIYPLTDNSILDSPREGMKDEIIKKCYEIIEHCKLLGIDVLFYQANEDGEHSELDNIFRTIIEDIKSIKDGSVSQIRERKIEDNV